MTFVKMPDSVAPRTQERNPSATSSSLSQLRPLKNILVAIDFPSSSQAVIRNAIRFSHLLGANLFVVHIFEYADAGSPATAGIVEGLIALRRKAQRRLEAIVRKIRLSNVQAITRDGLAAKAILDVIAEKSIDLAILGTENARGIERFVFGSTAEAVFRKAPCPLLTVGPHAHVEKAIQPQDPIVFATDLNPETSHTIRYAASLCRTFGAPLHCIQVLPPSVHTHGVAPIIPEIMTEALEHIIKKNGVAVEQSICSIAYEISDAIVDYAKNHKAQLIVLGVQRASAIASHLPLTSPIGSLPTLLAQF